MNLFIQVKDHFNAKHARNVLLTFPIGKITKESIMEKNHFNVKIVKEDLQANLIG